MICPVNWFPMVKTNIFKAFENQAFPNPARDYTLIPYELPEASTKVKSC